MKEKEKISKPKYSAFENVCYIMKMLWKCDKGFVGYTMFKEIFEKIYAVFFVVYLTKYIYICIEKKTPFNELFVIVSVMCGIHVLIHAISAGHQYYLKTHVPEIYRYIFSQVIDKSEKMEYKNFEEPNFYDKFTRALNESVTRGIQILIVFSFFSGNCISTIIAIKMVIDVDPFMLVFIIPSIIASFLLGSKTGNLYYSLDFANTRDGRVGAYVKRVFYEKKYAGELRLFNIKDVLLNKHKQATDGMYQRTKEIRKKIAIYESIRWSIFCIMSIVLPMLYVAFVVKKVSGIDVASYIAMVSALEFISSQISWSVGDVVDINKNGKFINNLHEFLDIELKENGENVHELTKSLDDIEIKNMGFTYEGAKKPTLHNLNIHIKKGERVAFVGHNGAGKTTLVKLLMGLYKVTEGEIIISGENINNYELKSYHQHFGTVFQDLQVFALPISHNVIMHEPKDEDERQLVVTALEKAQFGDKLKTLEHGIDTMVSKEFDENGVVLSGGETQKIAIARIFAKNPDIVILDEPSSALDPIAEYNMYKNMMEISDDKTVLFISHRLSSARIADRIYMLENGTVIEEGTHDALMARDGKYAQMFNLQAQNYQESLPEGMGEN